MDDPLTNAARGLIRQVAGDEVAERFDAALEDYGEEQAASEALAGAVVGVGFRELRRQARRGSVTPEESARLPNIEQRTLDDRRGLVLTVDVAHDELEVTPHDDLIVLRTPWGYFEHAVGFNICEIEWRTDPGAAIAEFEIRPDVVEIEMVEDGGGEDADADEAGGGTD